jgi:hypothetical protein
MLFMKIYPVQFPTPHDVPFTEVQSRAASVGRSMQNPIKKISAKELVDCFINIKYLPKNL